MFLSLLEKNQIDERELIINQLDSLLEFEKHILPFIIGKKHNEYQEIINKDKNNSLSYNYLLPNECKNEIYDMSKIMNISLNSIGNKLGYDKNNFKVSKTELSITHTNYYIQIIFQLKLKKLNLVDILMYMI